MTDLYQRMTTAPVRGLIVRLALPTMASMLVTALYNLATTFYVGRLSTQATAAVGVAFAAMAVIQAVGFFFGQGSGNAISRHLGAQQQREAERMAATGFYGGIVVSAVLGLAALVLLTPLCRALGATATILPHTREYLAPILLGAPVTTAAFTLNNQLRFQGNALLGMAGIVSGSLLNIALQPVFIFTLGWGLRGAAVCTVLCQAVSLGILLWLNARRGCVPLALTAVSPTREVVAETVRGGLPSLARQGLACLATLLLNHAAGAFGDAAIAGMSITTRLTFMIYAVFIGFGQGYQPVCGYCYGAHRYDRVWQGFRFCTTYGTAGMALLATGGIMGADTLVTLFRDDAEVVAVGATALRWQLMAYPLNMFVTISNMTLQTIGRARPATILACARQGIFFIPLILGLPPLIGLAGVQLATPLADLGSFLLAFPLVRGTLRELRGG